ncbi:MAG: glutamate-1-semialdehyde-2,1-aminomutase [Proteobacteria bacterium]|nr:glutamate-1-semialdehyde-2,1-aminomutase [Pseudomonadota bacterium]
MTTTIRNRSRDLFERAQGVIPGGVNSPVRAFRSVGGEPVFISAARGARVLDADGNEYIDFIGSWGPMIVGHAHPRVLEAITRAAERGTSYGAPCELEVELAEEIRRAMPSMELVRMVNSGTEAAMSALRVARGFTGRDKVVKFVGCYHGHGDSFLVKAGSGALTLGVPDSAGVPADFARHTLTVPFNDEDAIRAVIEAHGSEIAALVVEPIPANMGLVAPNPGFLQLLRDLTAQHGIVLIFDEVMTGFRVGYGGVQALTGIRPDMTLLAKIIGGGLPVGAYGGRRDIMQCVAPLGPVYQAGTLSGNPLAMAAGLETLRILRDDPQAYARLEEGGRRVEGGLREAADAAGVPVVVNRQGSMLTLFFHPGPAVDSYAAACASDTERYGRFFRAMLEKGVMLAPSQYEAAFVSLAHTDDQLDRAAAAAREAMRSLVV